MGKTQFPTCLLKEMKAHITYMREEGVQQTQSSLQSRELLRSSVRDQTVEAERAPMGDTNNRIGLWVLCFKAHVLLRIAGFLPENRPNARRKHRRSSWAGGGSEGHVSSRGCHPLHPLKFAQEHSVCSLKVAQSCKEQARTL